MQSDVPEYISPEIVGNLIKEFAQAILFSETDINAGGIEEATAGYNYDMKCSSLAMLYWSQGLFSFVSTLQPVIDALEPYCPLAIESVTPPSTPGTWDGDLRIPSLQAAYKSGLSPVTVIESLYKTIEAYAGVDKGVWIHLVKKDDAIEAAKALAAKYPNRGALPPLFGIPFSIKDSLDIAGLPTTTGMLNDPLSERSY